LVVTKFALEPVSNKEGIKYSLLNCQPTKWITDPAEGKRIKKLFTDLRPIMREQVIVSEEYA
jgi:hypothetical protein